MKTAPLLKYILLSVMLLSCCAYHDAKQVKKPSEIETLQSAFEEIKKAGWDVNSDLLWGYFFIDSEEEKLRRLGKHLESLDYRLVEVSNFDNGKGDIDGYRLHVEKVEKHSSATLARRNQEFRDLAAKFAVKSYDGWDVGKVK